MKWLLTCWLLLAMSLEARAAEYQSFEGLMIGQTSEEIATVVDGRDGFKVKAFPLPEVPPALAAVIGRPADKIEIKLVVDATSQLEPAVAIVAFDGQTGGAIWLSLYPRWLGLGAFGQRVTAQLISQKYGVGEMQPDRCDNDICLVGQASTGEVIIITPASNVRVYPPPG
ncbi:MAG: hypothetical protein ACOZAM_15480 [Pseudomonadota bacterium]